MISSVHDAVNWSQLKAYFLLGTKECYPDLLDTGAEELVAGLESGAWTSVDLTKVFDHSIFQSTPLTFQGIYPSH